MAISSKLSDEQLAEFKKVFAEFDKDSSGSISKEEFGAALKKCGFEPSQEEVDALMKAADSDGGGTLDLDEFISLVIRVNIAILQAKLVAAFKAIDTDGSGYIVASEIGANLTPVCPASSAAVERRAGLWGCMAVVLEGCSESAD